MKRASLIVGATTLSIALVCVLGIFFLRIEETKARREFSIAICDNLMLSGYITDESDCLLSERVPDVMQAMFPTGSANIDRVRSGMDGFEEILYSTGIPCLSGGSRWERLKYVVWENLFRFDENYGFVFCDGILVDQYWED